MSSTPRCSTSASIGRGWMFASTVRCRRSCARCLASSIPASGQTG
jgi:hypothetical protein